MIIVELLGLGILIIMRQCGLGDSDYSGTPCDSVG